MTNGWNESAAAWIAHVDNNDFGRRFVLDAPMLARVGAMGAKNALDVGCGEGRFCRMLRAQAVEAIGVDPTPALIERALSLDPEGDYRIGRAEALEFADERFDLVVSYLTLIDIADHRAAIGEMHRVLRQGGVLLMANLNGFATAAVGGGWRADGDGVERFAIDRYLEERAVWAEWDGIRVQNWHRPLSAYMSVFLNLGMRLRHFAEPAPADPTTPKAQKFVRAPWFVMMEWEKAGQNPQL
jgi:SAM-dependent methyltransferase